MAALIRYKLEVAMRFDIQARDFTLTAALRAHAERRLRFALARADDQLLGVVMRLSDINGPRGGTDKRCRIQVLLQGLPNVVVEDTQRDLYVAIDRATDRIGRAVARRLARQREPVRRPGPAAPAWQSYEPD